MHFMYPTGEMRDVNSFFVGNSKWKRQLGRSRHLWEINIIVILFQELKEGHGLDRGGSGEGLSAGNF